jgi:hypothetical protein
MQTTESDTAAGRTFTEYCPLHEYDRDECDEFCLPRRKELWRIDAALRTHWARLGFSFYDRGRAR